MELDEIKELISLLEQSKLKKLFLKRGDDEILLEKEGANHPYPPHQSSMHIPLPSVHEETKREEDISEDIYVTSPMVGTFYTSSAPDQPPFIKVGDSVDEDTVICIIEAMKVLNEVKAGVKGVVKEILITDAHPVEYGSKLFRIENV